MRFVGRGRGFDDCGYVYESVTKLGNLFFFLGVVVRVVVVKKKKVVGGKDFFLLSRRKLLVGKIFCREKVCWWERFFCCPEESLSGTFFFLLSRRKFVGGKVFLSRESLLVGKIFFGCRRREESLLGTCERFFDDGKTAKMNETETWGTFFSCCCCCCPGCYCREESLLKTCQRF